MDLARLIDHTDLRPQANDGDIRRLADEAIRHGFASACVNGRHVPLLARLLQGSGVGVASVVGFPLGAASSDAKVTETRIAVSDGATEIDMVVSIGDLLALEDVRVHNEIFRVRHAARDAVLKVILECGLLTDEDKRRGAAIAVKAGADYVKTSTGFGHGGATVEDVRLLREVVGPDIGVKASGGIRTREQAEALVRAGATRLGTSAGPDLVS